MMKNSLDTWRNIYPTQESKTSNFGPFPVSFTYGLYNQAIYQLLPCSSSINTGNCISVYMANDWILSFFFITFLSTEVLYFHVSTVESHDTEPHYAQVPHGGKLVSTD